MADGKVVIDSDLNEKGVIRGIKSIKRNLKTLDAELLRTAAIASVISIAPALSPAVASVTAGVLALSSAFVAAGVGIAGFGAIAITVLNDVFEANTKLAEAEKKLAEASNAEERKKALEEIKAATEGLSGAQKDALNSLREFQKFWDNFTKSFEPAIVNLFSYSLETLQYILEQLKPAFMGATKAIVGLMEDMNGALRSDQVRAFFDYLNSDAGKAITTFGQTFGYILLGIMNLMVAFSPLSGDMQNDMLNLAMAFAAWTSKIADSDAFQSFIDYVKTNGPMLMDLIGNLVMIIVNLGIALAPLGEAVLGVLVTFTDFINEFIKGNPMIAVMALVIAQVANTLLFLSPIISTIIGLVSSFIGWLTPLLINLTGAAEGTAFLRVALMAITGPIGIVIAVVTGLIAIFVTLWKTNEEFRNTVITVWNAIKTAVMTALQVAFAFIMSIWAQIQAFWNQNQAMIMAAVHNVWTVISTVIMVAMNIILGIFKLIWPIIKILIISTWEAIKNVIHGAINVILGIIKFFAALFTGNWSALWDAIKQMLSGALELIWGLFQLGFLGKIFKIIKLFIKGGGKFFGSFVNKVKDLFETLLLKAMYIWDAIKVAIMTPIKWVVGKVVGFFETLFLKALYKWDALKSAALSKFNAIKSFIMTPIKNAKDRVIGFFEDMYLKALYKWDAIKSAAVSKFNSIKKAIMDPIRNAVDFVKKQIDKIVGFFKGMKISLPKIKLPHFSVRGKLDLNPVGGISVPKLSVNWYKDGGLFAPNTPTLAGLGDNKLYDEVAMPLSPRVLKTIGDQIASKMSPSEKGGGSGNPAQITFVLGGTEYHAFVDDITETQERKKFKLRRK